MEAKINTILEHAGKVFMRYGIKSITMDDVARELGISKKTLYQFFTDKNDLVKQCIEMRMKADQCMYDQISSEVTNAIDELFQVNKTLASQMGQVHPSIMFDLQKYHPEAYKVFKSNKASCLLASVIKNFKRGIEEGFYDETLDTDIMSRLYVSKIDAIFDTELFPNDKYSLPTIHRELIVYHIRAIATPKGLKYLLKKLSTPNK